MSSSITSKRSITIAGLLIGMILPIAYAFSQPAINAPDVASLNKFIDQPVDKKTGIPSINIPIYTLQLNGYSLPISLSYHAGGIGVEEVASSVGLGWSLNASGMISRSVMDSPDEGGYYGVGAIQPTPQSHVGDDPSGTGVYTYDRDPREGYDTEPDILYFNINGYSGKFVVDKTGKTQLLPEQDLEITGDFTGWQITDPSGTQYFFVIQKRDTDDRNSSVTTAWHLDKIITPALDVIQFEYVGQGYSMDKSLNHRSAAIAVGAVYLQQGQDFNYSSVSSLQISRITSTKCDIVFEYQTDKRTDFKDVSPYSSIMYALKDIKIIDNYSNTEINRFDFSTSYFTCNGTQASTGDEDFLKQRLRLDMVTERGVPPYVFYYNKHNLTPGGALPSRISKGQDFWGLYNGKDSNTGLFPKLVHPFLPIVYADTGNDRDPNEDYSKAFILDEIIYPTGGVTTYLYEGIRDYANVLLGGLRVKEIRTKSAGNPDLVKQYQYYNPYIIGGKPRFVQEISDCAFSPHTAYNELCLTHSTTNNWMVMASTSPAITTAGVSSQYIFHETVVETQPGNGTIEYYYDVSGAQNEQADYDNDQYPITSRMPLLLGTDLLKEVYKDKNGTIIKEILNSYGVYTRGAIHTTDAYKCFRICGPEFYKFYGLTTGCSYISNRQEYTYSEYPTKYTLVSTNFEHKGIPGQSGSYTPTLHQFVTREVSQRSDGSVAVKHYKYPLDYQQDYAAYSSSDSWSSDALAVKSLADRWMIQKPVEEITSVYRNGTETIIHGNVTFYKSTLFSTEGKTQLSPRSTANFEPPTITTYSSAFDSKINKDGNNVIQFQFNGGYKEKTVFDTYDAFGNLLEYHQTDHYPVSFLWGYHHTEPIAEVKNASNNEVYFEGFEESTLSSVKTDVTLAHTGLHYYDNTTFAVNWSKPNGKTYTLRYWVKQNEKWNYVEQAYGGAITLSGGTAFDDVMIYPTGAMVSTYTYQPLTGMTSSSKNSNTTYYEYDAQNRLKNIKDLNNNIQDNYTYHYYKSPSDQFSSSALIMDVQKNDCPNLAVGSMTEYTVPAGKYTSFISQEDADAKAQQEVDAQAQLSANIYGICTGGTVPYKSAAFSGEFRKSCPFGQTGTELVPYSVPAGKYTSPNSQAEANALALQDLNTNGQLKANTNTTCEYMVGVEMESSVDYTNQINRVRFYDEYGTVLLYDFSLADLYNANYIKRAVYKVVADVSGVTYKNLTLLAYNGTGTSYCQNRTGATTTFTFDSLDLTTTIHLSILLGDSCQ